MTKTKIGEATIIEKEDKIIIQTPDETKTLPKQHVIKLPNMSEDMQELYMNFLKKIYKQKKYPNKLEELYKQQKIRKISKKKKIKLNKS